MRLTARRPTTVEGVELLAYGEPVQRVVFAHDRLGWLVKFVMVPIRPGRGPNSLYSIDAVVRAPDRFPEAEREQVAELQKRSLAAALRILSPRRDVQLAERVSTDADEEGVPDGAGERDAGAGERTDE
jgi:hypothetical protein